MIAVKRFLNKPIIYPHMDDRMGDNINGPSLIRAPNWLKKPLGRYYLYFSGHKGTYIRLAFSNSLMGPWEIYYNGVLELNDSYFMLQDSFDDSLYAHIASPDVHVDDENGRIVMYFHGQLSNGDQVTRVATSQDGVTFCVKEQILGPPYFRVFQYLESVFAICWGGEIWRSQDWFSPFEKGPKILPFNSKDKSTPCFRHGEVFREQDLLHIFFSNIGDAPEHILYCKIELSEYWNEWKTDNSYLILEPELNWEGANMPISQSVIGIAQEKARELRDPCIFQDTDNQIYLLYSGGGERGIGLVKLFNS